MGEWVKEVEKLILYIATSGKDESSSRRPDPDASLHFKVH